jgi:hypothetical protein
MSEYIPEQNENTPDIVQVQNDLGTQLVEIELLTKQLQGKWVGQILRRFITPEGMAIKIYPKKPNEVGTVLQSSVIGTLNIAMTEQNPVLVPYIDFDLNFNLSEYIDLQVTAQIRYLSKELAVFSFIDDVQMSVVELD